VQILIHNNEGGDQCSFSYGDEDVDLEDEDGWCAGRRVAAAAAAKDRREHGGCLCSGLACTVGGLADAVEDAVHDETVQEDHEPERCSDRGHDVHLLPEKVVCKGLDADTGQERVDAQVVQHHVRRAKDGEHERVGKETAIEAEADAPLDVVLWATGKSNTYHRVHN